MHLQTTTPARLCAAIMHHLRAVLPLFVLLLPVEVAALQTAPTAMPECACVASFDAFVAKLEENYIGHAMLVGDANRREYQALKQQLRQRAEATAESDCVLVLRELTGWFADPHLFVSERPRVPADSIAVFRAAARRDGRSEAELRSYLESNRATLDPIEGIWYSAPARHAVVRDGTGFVAITLTDTVAGWEPGFVRARFEPRAAGEYMASFLSDSYVPLHMTALLRNGLLLHMAPMTWGREYPLAQHQIGALHHANPRAPVLRVLDDGTVLLVVPSLDPAFRAGLDSLVAANRDAIESAATLVVDLRGNEGGSPATIAALLRYIRTPALRAPATYQGAPTILASRENIEYFRGWRPPPEVLERMQAALGTVVSFPGLLRTEPWAEGTEATPRPENVAIITDRGVVSAAEAFVLDAMRSTKVTVFGANTGGSIDFQNVRLTAFGCRRAGLYLGLPMLAAHELLPLHGINATGVAPHVPLETSHPDLVQRILQYYRR